MSLGLMRARTLFLNDQNRLVLLPFIRAGLPISRGQVFKTILSNCDGIVKLFSQLPRGTHFLSMRDLGFKCKEWDKRETTDD